MPLADMHYNFVQYLTGREPMHPDRVEVSWDSAKSQWLVRIETGEEVIRRHCKMPRDASEQTIISAARQTVQDEGYEPDAGDISIRRN